MNTDSKKTETKPCTIHNVGSRTYHFMGWVDGKHVDKMIDAINREKAIEKMKVEYPRHDFEYICELS